MTPIQQFDKKKQRNLVYINGFGFININYVLYIIRNRNYAIEIKLHDGTILTSNQCLTDDDESEVFFSFDERNDYDRPNDWEFALENFSFRLDDK